MASGGTTEALGNRNGALYSMHGFQRVSGSEIKHVALFHALILAPEAHINGSGSAFSTECLLGTETLTWRLASSATAGTREQALVMTFDGRKKSLMVGDQVASATPENVFVIVLDEAWRPSMSSAHVTVSEQASSLEVISRVRAALPDNDAVQHARLYTEVHK